MEELVAPYNAFKARGYDVTVSSVTGGEIPVDEASLSPPYVTKDVEEFILNDEHMKELTESVPLAEVNASEYDAIFLPGGAKQHELS
jgi:putative intracellular protease/amidase